MNTQPLNSEIVNYSDLLAVSKCKSAAELAGWLETNRIPFFRGTGRARQPFTTRAALNSALGIFSTPASPDGKIEVL